ncbi:hypothetical protein GS682_08685 [Nostoc sp. B(2019)]|nr:hypothetical protein [Nostoc sp. B(2019)]
MPLSIGEYRQLMERETQSCDRAALVSKSWYYTGTILILFGYGRVDSHLRRWL